MGSIITIAPKGNLIIAAGQDEDQRVVKVLSVVLQLVSPVFDVMLGPNFYEGRVQYDASNPLRLPFDSPRAMVNMFRIFHHRNDEIEEYQEWITDLVMVADKYCTLPRLKDTFRAIITDEDYQNALSAQSRLVISGLAGMEVMFSDTSTELLRNPLDSFEEFIDPKLLSLVPDAIIDGMRNYRHEALQNYQSVLRELDWKIRTLPRENTCCQEFHDAIINFIDSDTIQRIRSATSPDQIVLENIHQQLFRLIPDEHTDPPRGCLHLNYCNERCTTVVPQLYDAIYDAANNINYGTHSGCELCIRCFRADTFGIKGNCSRKYGHAFRDNGKNSKVLDEENTNDWNDGNEWNEWVEV